MSFSIAGIIPVAGQKLDFNMPWHDALMAIGQDYLAVERSVVECANAGCSSIWIVCNDDMQPLIRYRLGEMVQDPVWVVRQYEYNKKDFQRPIQIHYVPISARDVNKRDCLSWSVLYGAKTAHKICGGLSKALVPDKFYVSWPYGYYAPTFVRKHRGHISSKRNFFLSFNGKTVVDGEYLGFTFDYDTLNELKDQVVVKSTGLWRDPSTRKDRLPIDERFSYKNFKVEDVFGDLSVENNDKIELHNYWRIDSWESYCEYISEYGSKAKRPSEFILKYKEWNGIGVDYE